MSNEVKFKTLQYMEELAHREGMLPTWLSHLDVHFAVSIFKYFFFINKCYNNQKLKQKYSRSTYSTNYNFFGCN